MASWYPRMGLGMIALLAAAPSWADEVCATPGGCSSYWQPFRTPLSHAQAPDNVGSTYFDGYSWDGPNANIAYFIEGQGYFQGDPNSPQAALPYWGMADAAGSPVSSFYFHSNGQPQIATFLEARGLWAPYNSVGWYDATNPSTWGWVLQANGTQPAPQLSVEFTPTTDFGLFVVPDSLTFDPLKAYYTDSSRNGIAQADVDYANQNAIPLGPESVYQHFAVFNGGSAGYYIGVGDRSPQIGDRDFNDLIFTLTETPEPSYVWALAAGITVLLISGMRRRVRNRRSGATPHDEGSPAIV